MDKIERTGPIAVTCPSCHAEPGRSCRIYKRGVMNNTGAVAYQMHDRRVRRAANEAAERRARERIARVDQAARAWLDLGDRVYSVSRRDAASELAAAVEAWRAVHAPSARKRI